MSATAKSNFVHVVTMINAVAARGEGAARQPKGRALNEN
jgi:hypothetical protein